MKLSQRQIYAARIDRVIGHIERRMHEETVPGLTELAGVAAMSEFHFHRVFRLMTGETVGEAVRRIRLARTLPELGSEMTISQAAGASGYATSQSFARALKAQSGISATTARANTTALDALASTLRKPRRHKTDEPVPMEIEVVSVEPFRLLAIRNTGDYAELNQGYAQVFDLVYSLMAPECVGGIYGVPHDDPRFTKMAECRFDCALAVNSVVFPENGLIEMSLGGGDYVRLRCLGNYDRLHGTIDLAYAAAIAMLDREIGNAPLFIHYLDDPEEVAEADLRSDIYLPLI